jgi:hypothetical protein
VAAQVLVKLGADLNRVRQQVIQLLHGYQGKEPAAAGAPSGRASHDDRRLIDELIQRISAIESRLSAIERRLDTGPGTGPLGQ